MGSFSSVMGVTQARQFVPLTLTPSEPQTPSPQEWRKAKLSSCFLISSRASRSIMPWMGRTS